MILRTKGLYASGMVLQHDKISMVKGLAKKNSVVTLEYRGQKIQSETLDDGSWSLEFNAKEAGGPFLFKLSCEDEVLEYQVYSGEVWISSGQSNAQLPMERMKFSYPDEFSLAENPLIRMVTVPITWNFQGETDDFYAPPSFESSSDGNKNTIPVRWDAASPKTLGGMSGTAYFFAKKLALELKIPVGIINASQGGSPISAWLSKSALEQTECQTDYLSSLLEYENPENVKLKQQELKKNQSEWDNLVYQNDEGIKNHWEKLSFAECGDWSECTVPGFLEEFSGAGIVWIKKEVVLTKTQAEHFNSKNTWLWLGTIVDADRAFVNGVEVGITYYSYPPRRYQVPKGILQEGKNTITVRLQKNSSWGKIRFYKEKPYFLFTDNVKISPTACRNVEIFEESTEDGEKISLCGTWKMKVGTSVKDCPPGMFFEWIPTALYNGMLSPCFTQAVAGALWYQGESDAGRFKEYKALLQKLMELWRQKFSYSQNDFPFVVVQLPNWSDGYEETSVNVNPGWAELRKAQEKAVESDKNAALAVTIDAGEWNDLHPEKKFTVGTRSAEQALRLAYDKKYYPPAKFESFQKEGDFLKVKFNLQGSKLKAFAIKPDGKSADFKKEAKTVQGFSFITEKGGKPVAVAAKAELISFDEVKVYLPKEAKMPEELRYLYTDCPSPVNLYNEEGLPVLPFSCKL